MEHGKGEKGKGSMMPGGGHMMTDAEMQKHMEQAMNSHSEMGNGMGKKKMKGK